MLPSSGRRLLHTSRRLLQDASDSRPTGLIANEGIELLTFGTPNGHKASIMLEELKEAYGKNYTFQSIHIGQNIQKEAWYTKLNPNGRIPVIVDHDRSQFAVMEGSSILTYLARYYDPEQRFHFTDPDDLSRQEQWLCWMQSGIGPMQGQANHFFRLAKERIPYPTQRYVGETERLYGVLDKRLEDRDYIVGPGRGKYSIVDIAHFGWVNCAYFAGVDLSWFKNLDSWAKKIAVRPAVKKGLAVPSESRIINEVYLQRMKSEPDFAEKERELAELRDKAKAQYNYKYASP